MSNITRAAHKLQFRAAASITSWFFHPDLGMDRFEVLSRSSCFATTTLSGSMLHLVASQHVTHPFRYPQFYPEAEYPWLQALEKDHIKLTLEFRQKGTGDILFEHPLAQDDHLVHCHPQLDLVVVHPQGTGADLVEGLGERGLMLELMEWASDDAVAAIRETTAPGSLENSELPLRFVGHRLDPRFNEETHQDESRLYPATVRGASLGGDSPRFVAATEAQLEMGMCGGPVLNSEGEVLGMVEGIVPESHSQLSGCAVCIDGAAVRSFVEETSQAIRMHEMRQSSASSTTVPTSHQGEEGGDDVENMSPEAAAQEAQRVAIQLAQDDPERFRAEMAKAGAPADIIEKMLHEARQIDEGQLNQLATPTPRQRSQKSQKGKRSLRERLAETLER